MAEEGEVEVGAKAHRLSAVVVAEVDVAERLQLVLVGVRAAREHEGLLVQSWVGELSVLAIRPLALLPRRGGGL